MREDRVRLAAEQTKTYEPMIWATDRNLRRLAHRHTGRRYPKGYFLGFSYSLYVSAMSSWNPDKGEFLYYYRSCGRSHKDKLLKLFLKWEAEEFNRKRLGLSTQSVDLSAVDVYDDDRRNCANEKPDMMDYFETWDEAFRYIVGDLGNREANCLNQWANHGLTVNEIAEKYDVPRDMAGRVLREALRGTEKRFREREPFCQMFQA